MMKNSTRGFTLVETLIAISILATAIIGPFVAIQTAFTVAYVARDQLVGTLLAEEGIEYARAARDSNYLYMIQNPGSSISWLYGLDGTSGSVDCVDPNPSDSSARNCVIDPTGNTPIALCALGGAGTCPALNMSPANLYTQASGYPATRFTRKLTIISISATEAQVSVTVSWTTNHQTYSVTLTEILRNWL